LKIIRVVSELDFGGVEQVLAVSIPELAKKQGVEISVLVLGRGGKMSDFLQDQGIKVIILNKSPRIPNFRLVWELKGIIKKIGADVVHCQGAEANFHGLWAAELAGVKTKIGEEIGIPNHHSYWRWIFKWVYKKADRVVAISESVSNKITDLKEVSKRKIKVIYNPSAINSLKLSDRKLDLTFPEIVADEKCFVFVTTCRLVPIKNLDRLILCFYELVKSNPHLNFALWIIGEGGERENLRELTIQKKLTHCVRFFGFRESVHQFLLAADVFILPSLSEGSSVSLAEAMMTGLPSIVTEVGGAKEILGGSRSGILVNPKSSDSILAAMQSIVDLSESERIEMGRRGKIESRRFSVDVYLAELMQVYNK
jgi:glycosyltransferase involved in cell wall biosynthesis